MKRGRQAKSRRSADVLSHVGHRRVGCLNPDKHRFYSIKKARATAEEWGQQVYACGNHYHLTTKSWGDPEYVNRSRRAGT